MILRNPFNTAACQHALRQGPVLIGARKVLSQASHAGAPPGTVTS